MVQAPTHMLFGIFLADLVYWLFPSISMWIYVISVCILAFSSHFLIDAIAILTYHPPKADLNDNFWVGYHIAVYLLALFILIIFFKLYWWVIISAILVDLIDWILLRFLLKKDPLLHHLADKLRAQFFSQLKDFNQEKWTILFEIVIIVILAALIYVL